MSKVKIEYDQMFCKTYYDYAYISLEEYPGFIITIALDCDEFQLGLLFKDTQATGKYSGTLATPWFQGKGGWDKPIGIDLAVRNDSILIDFNASNLKQYNLTPIDFIELIEAIGAAARFLQSERM